MSATTSFGNEPSNAADIVKRLFSWLAIPSISADPSHRDDVRQSALWFCDAARDAGFTGVEILETAGHPSALATWTGAGDDAPTVLVYGHHDVQPVDPIEQWEHPPFDPVIVNGECRARGAIDDKGQVLYHLEAVRNLLGQAGSLPVNIKLLVEGEEEVGSPNFSSLLEDCRDDLACDVVVVSDTSMIAPDIPSTDVAMRGLVACTVTVTTSSRDAHSGMFGGAIPNPIHHLVRITAALHDRANRVAIPGFYDAVRPLSPEEVASLAEQPFDEDDFAHLVDVNRLEGEDGYSTLERIGARPTAEVVGMSGGYGGEGIKTIVPGRAHAKLAFRLVPDQEPAVIMTLIENWLATQVPSGIAIDVEWHGGVAPASTPIDSWAFGALCSTMENVWGRAPLLTRVGGSGPEEMLARILDAPLIFLGVGLPGDRIHAPNERMDMEQFFRGLRSAEVLYSELARAFREQQR